MFCGDGEIEDERAITSGAEAPAIADVHVAVETATHKH
jgi:hypothetical protein